MCVLSQVIKTYFMPVRRSSRLARKKKVNYDLNKDDNFFKRVLGKIRTGWQKTVTRLEAKPAKKLRVKKSTQAFKRKQLFRKKKPQALPQPPKEIVRVKAKQTKSKFEKDVEAIDLTGDSPEVRMERIRDRKAFRPLSKVATKQTISRKHKHLLFMNPGDDKIMEALYSLERGGQLPKWAWSFQENLKTENGRLLWFENDRGG